MSRYITPAADYARAALAVGPLVMQETFRAGRGAWRHYRFRGRLFNTATINGLIDAGEAVRDGNTVRAA